MPDPTKEQQEAPGLLQYTFYWPSLEEHLEIAVNAECSGQLTGD